MGEERLSVTASRVAGVLAAIATAVILAGVVGQLVAYTTGHDHIFGLVRLLHSDGENNVPALFSTLLLAGAAVLLAYIAVMEKRRASSLTAYWVVLSAGFLVMAADEALSFHEQLNRPVRAVLGEGELGLLYFSWVVPATMLVLVLGLVFLRFLLKLPKATRTALLVAAALYLGGAIVVEAIGGAVDEAYGQANLGYSMIATAEESLEIAGLIVLIWALLVYVADNLGDVLLQFRK